MDSETSDVRPAAVEGVEFLPAHERWDQTSYAVASFLARHRDLTLRAYRQDMLAFLRWYAERQLAPLEAQRPHLELYLRWMETQGLAPATIRRRFGTVAGFCKYAVLGGHVPADPTLAVTRPRIAWEGQRRTVLHPLEYAALLTATQHHGPQSHALVALLGILGLLVSEACGANVTDLHYDSGYELLTIMGKDRKPAQIPLPVPVLRGPRSHGQAEGRPDPAQPRRGPADTCRRGGAAAPAGRRDRARQPDQSPQPAPDFLHRRARVGRPATRHAVRHAAQRLPHHPALRREPSQPRPPRRPPRRRLPRRHSRRVTPAEAPSASGLIIRCRSVRRR